MDASTIKRNGSENELSAEQNLSFDNSTIGEKDVQSVKKMVSFDEVDGAVVEEKTILW